MERVGFSTPFAVVHDTVDDVYLVSNVNGAATARDGNGFISRLSPSSRVTHLRWIDGTQPGTELHAPKGLAIWEDMILVADIDCIRRFHRATGRPAASICPPGAASLNAIAIDRDGLVYITDAVLSPEGHQQVGGRLLVRELEGLIVDLYPGAALGGPSGIAAGPSGVFFTTFREGRVYQVRPRTPYTVMRGYDWQLGGIAFTRDGSFAISNWSDSSVLYVEADGPKGQVWSIIRGIPSPGGIGYDRARHRFIIPDIHTHRVLLLNLS